MRHVALLRGINVGGKNLIRMADLKAAFEEMGFTGVATLLASGNVVFGSEGATGAALEQRFEAGLAKAFGYDARVLVRSRTQMRAVASQAPRGWPRADLRCNVVFVKAPLTPKAALAALDPKPGIDTAAAGPGVVYAGTRKDALAKSGLSKVVAKKAYQLMTIRTFGTCAKTLALMEA